MNKRFITHLFYSSLVFIASCSSSAKMEYAYKIGDIIQKPGTYFNEDLEIEIGINEYENSITYFVLDSNSDTLLKSNEEIGRIFYWQLLYSTDDHLWLYNSDNGYSIWAKDSTNKYKKYNLAFHEEFYIFLPDTLKKHSTDKLYQTIYDAQEKK